MQTLGLAPEARRSDGPFKSLLWPTVDNAWDVDYLGRQGMWVCTAVGVLILITSFFTGNMVAGFVGLLMALFYVLGGMGIRQGSWPAAAAIFVVYFLSIVPNLSLYPIGILRLAVAAVLLANVRAAFLASEWKPAAEGEDRPTRFSESLADRYIDQLPAVIWPKAQIPFAALAILVALLNLLGVGFLIAQRFGLFHLAK